MNSISFTEAIELAKQIIRRFEKVEAKPWGVEGGMIELSKQVGELAKLVMVQERYYFPDRDKLDSKYDTSKEKIGDELADILFAIIRIADHYGIDLNHAHIKAREDEDVLLKSLGA